MHTRVLGLAALVAAFALAAAGCGGDDNSDNGSSGSSKQSSGASGGGSGGASAGGGGASMISLSAPASGALKFDKSSINAKAGKVTINFDNPSQVPHAVEVEGNGVEEETKTVTNGKASVTVDLKKGKYEFYCPVDGHRQAGMEGTLTVG